MKPEGVMFIPCTWVFVQKEGPAVKSDDTEKARLRARGDMQEFGVNYEETFAPVQVGFHSNHFCIGQQFGLDYSSVGC